MAKEPAARVEPTIGAARPDAKSIIPDTPKIEVVQAEEGKAAVTQAEATPSLEDQLAEMRKQLDAERAEKAAAAARAEAAERAAAEATGKADTNEAAALRNHENAVKQAQEATKAALAQAKRDYASLLEQGKYAEAADAQEMIARATNQAIGLDNEVKRIDAYKETLKNRPATQPARAGGAPRDQVNTAQMPREAQQWLSQHPEFLDNWQRWNKLSAGHTDALAEGITPYSPEYFDHVERFVGLKKDGAGAIEADQTPRVPAGGAAVPPSRGASPQTPKPTGATQVALTARQREIARASWPELPAHEAEVRYAENYVALLNEGRIGRPN